MYLREHRQSFFLWLILAALRILVKRFCKAARGQLERVVLGPVKLLNFLFSSFYMFSNIRILLISPTFAAIPVFVVFPSMQISQRPH